MDFGKVLKKITGEFVKNKIKYALIGGYALGLYGVVRSTADLDFLIAKDQAGLLKILLKKYLYAIVYESENVIQFEHPTGVFGSLDFLYAFRPVSLEMLIRAPKKKIFGGEIVVPVALPEDIIGLKIQAMHNDPGRLTLDMEDIKGLMAANAKGMDWKIIKAHFEMFGRVGLFEELKNEYFPQK